MASGEENNPPGTGESQYRRQRRQKAQISFRKPDCNPMPGQATFQDSQDAEDPHHFDNKTLRELAHLQQLGALGARMDASATGRGSRQGQNDDASAQKVRAYLEKQIRRNQGDHLEARLREAQAIEEADDLEILFAQIQREVALGQFSDPDKMDAKAFIECLTVGDDPSGIFLQSDDAFCEASSRVTSPTGGSASHRDGLKQWVSKQAGAGSVSENDKAKVDGASTGGSASGAGRNPAPRQGKSAKKGGGRKGKCAQKGALETTMVCESRLKDPDIAAALRYASMK